LPKICFVVSNGCPVLNRIPFHRQGVCFIALPTLPSRDQVFRAISRKDFSLTNRATDKPGILFLIPSLSRAGAEMQAVSLANGLNTANFRKYLLCYRENLDQLSRIKPNEVEFIHAPRKNRVDISLIKKVARIIDQHSIDLIHCTIQHAFLIGWLARFLSIRKPRLVAAIHTTINKSPKGDLFDRWLYSRILKRCDRIVFVCHNQKKYWIDRYPFMVEKSTVVYNGVDPVQFDPNMFVDQGRQLRYRLNIPEKAPVICCIAGFRPEKSHDILIEAFSKIDPASFLLLAGDGEKKHEIQELVKAKKLEKRVRFLGLMPDVRPVLAASDVSVLSSTSVETFSMAMLESMSMQVPMVATDMGGLDEAIKPGETGVLVNAGDPHALAQGIARLIDKSRSFDTDLYTIKR
jgi:glycosyltransferase involved in cell wall biosynthesis